MRANKVVLVAVLALSSTMSMALGYVIGDSNLGFMGYPSFSSKQTKPRKPYSKDEWALDSYRREVERYVEASKEYVNACNGDMESIRDEKSKAIRESNAVIDEYNSFIRNGY